MCLITAGEGATGFYCGEHNTHVLSRLAAGKGSQELAGSRAGKEGQLQFGGMQDHFSQAEVNDCSTWARMVILQLFIF